MQSTEGILKRTLGVATLSVVHSIYGISLHSRRFSRAPVAGEHASLAFHNTALPILLKRLLRRLMSLYDAEGGHMGGVGEMRSTMD